MKKQKAFTLLELLVTSGITALLMLAISSLLITFLATAYKSRISQNLRQSGGNAMNQMIDMIRSSSAIVSECDATLALDHLTLIGNDGQESTILKDVDTDRIASVSATTKIYLTKSSTNPNYVQNLLFQCFPTAKGTKYIKISFVLKTSDNDADSGPRATTLDFMSGVATRN